MGSNGVAPPSLTQAEWDRLVERWHDRTAEERRAAHLTCRHRGRHRWTTVPIDWLVCLDCVTYAPIGEGRWSVG